MDVEPILETYPGVRQDGTLVHCIRIGYRRWEETRKAK